jgi:hypothetical protein
MEVVSLGEIPKPVIFNFANVPCVDTCACLKIVGLISICIRIVCLHPIVALGIYAHTY